MRFWLHPALECEKERKLSRSPTAEGERWASGLRAPRSRRVLPPHPIPHSGAKRQGFGGGVWVCMTPHPGNSGRRSGHILFHQGGGGYRRRGRVSNGNVTLCKRNSLNGTFRNIRGGGGGGGALFPPALFRATVLPARFGVEAAAVSIRMHD